MFLDPSGRFVQSPGITPLMTEIAILAFVLGVGLTTILLASEDIRRRTAATALLLGAYTLSMSAVKITTDYYDTSDLLISLVALAASILALTTGARLLLLNTRRSSGQRHRLPSLRILALFVGAVAVVAGTAKLHDFFDPFDLMLALSTIMIGLFIIYRYLKSSEPVHQTVEKC